MSIYLINCFTKLIDLANSVTDMAGTAHRYAWRGVKKKFLIIIRIDYLWCPIS